MARVISCSATTEQVIARTKTQTRRRGWWTDKKGRRLVLPGDQLQIVDKAMGLKKGQKPNRLALVEVVDVRRERLCDITPADVVSEGFPDWTTAEFIAFFTAEMGGSYNQELTVIEWRYLPAKFYITNEERPRPIDPYTFGGAAAAGMARPRLARRGGA